MDVDNNNNKKYPEMEALRSTYYRRGKEWYRPLQLVSILLFAIASRGTGRETIGLRLVFNAGGHLFLLYILLRQNPFTEEQQWLRHVSAVSSFTSIAGAVLMFLADSEVERGSITAFSWVVLVCCWVLVVTLLITYFAALWQGAEKEELALSRRLSKTENPVREACPDDEMELSVELTALQSGISIHIDEQSGQKYTFDPKTGKTEWLQPINKYSLGDDNDSDNDRDNKDNMFHNNMFQIFEGGVPGDTDAETLLRMLREKGWHVL